MNRELLRHVLAKLKQNDLQDDDICKSEYDVYEYLERKGCVICYGGLTEGYLGIRKTAEFDRIADELINS